MGGANGKKSGQTNVKLRKARKAKNDEFYTRRESVEAELQHYREHFRGKVVYCNCDDPRVSQFYLYFKSNFSFFGLKKLLATCYKSRNPDMFSRYDSERAVYIEYDGGDSEVRDFLESDGDFRSTECVDLLRRADVVVTNPPFSLFREYVPQLVAADKQFLVIGNYNAVSYREIFRLLKAEKLWLGSGHRTMFFDTPGGEITQMRNVIWFTNLDHKMRHDELPLAARYKGNESSYPKYDNYDAINVNRTVDIPRDYEGVMGVPISFLDKWNFAQFALVGSMVSTTVDEFNFGYPYIDGKRKFARILIKRKGA